MRISQRLTPRFEPFKQFDSGFRISTKDIRGKIIREEMADDPKEESRIYLVGSSTGEPYIAKIYAPIMPDSDDHRQFQREVDMLQHLQGVAGVPQYRSHGRIEVKEGEQFYPLLVTDFVYGQRIDDAQLKDSLRKSPRRRLLHMYDIGCQTAQILARLEKRGVLHLGITEYELVREYSGEIVLFGMANCVRQKDIRSKDILLKGEKYIAPEQRKGGVIDIRTSLYQLGWSLLSIFHDQRITPPGAFKVGRRRGGFDPEISVVWGGSNCFANALDAVVARCASDSREKRYDSAQTLLSALDPLKKEWEETVKEYILAELDKSGKTAKKRFFLQNPQSLMLRVKREMKARIINVKRPTLRLPLGQFIDDALDGLMSESVFVSIHRRTHPVIRLNKGTFEKNRRSQLEGASTEDSYRPPRKGQTEYTIGRAIDNNLILWDRRIAEEGSEEQISSVSRYHAVVIESEDGRNLKTLSDKQHGTTTPLGTHKLGDPPFPVGDGDVFSFGYCRGELYSPSGIWTAIRDKCSQSDSGLEAKGMEESGDDLGQTDNRFGKTREFKRPPKRRPNQDQGAKKTV